MVIEWTKERKHIRKRFFTKSLILLNNFDTPLAVGLLRKDKVVDVAQTHSCARDAECDVREN